MRINKVVFLFVFLVLVSRTIMGANVTSVSNIILNPVNPSPGDTVTVTYDFVIDNSSNDPHNLIVVSNQCTLRKWGTSGQDVLLGDGCAPDFNAVNGGCDTPGTFPAGTNTVSQVVTIPTTLIPGMTYYVAVGVRDYNIYINNDGEVAANNQACVSFTIPPPPPTINMIKTAEGSTAIQGGLVLYTVKYYLASTNNIVITDPIPPEIDFVEAYDGGMNVGGVVTWNMGDVSVPPVNGTLSWMGRVKVGVIDGAVISNVAYGNSNDIVNNTSNDATVTIGPALTLEKFANPTTANVGDTITFTFSYTNFGYALSEYVNYDSPADLTGWTQEVAGGTWTVANGYLEGNGNGSWPKIIKDSPALHDAMYTVDLLVPSSNSTGDAVFLFNFIDIDNQYHARIQTDTNQVCFDKVVSSGWSQVQCVTPPGPSLLSEKWYSLKIVVNGTNIKVKIWEKNSTEPMGWTIDLNDTSLPAAGRAGFQANEQIDRFDELKIFTPAFAYNVEIYDTLPACVTYVGSSDAGTYDPGSRVVTWSLGTLDNDSGLRSVYVTADTCSNATIVDNSGCIDSPQPAPEVCSNIASVAVGSLPSPTITQTATPTVTPTITESSTPTVTASITITPLGTSTETPTFSMTPSITPTESSTSTQTITMTSTPTPSATQTITPAPATIDMVLNVIDVSVTAGDNSEVQIILNNSGGETGSNIFIWDTVPADTTFDVLLSGNIGWTYSGDIISRNVGTLLPGQSVTYTYVLSVDAGIANNSTVIIAPFQGTFNDPLSPVINKYTMSNPGAISIGDFRVYPNPFNPEIAILGSLKFVNVPSGSLIMLYTLSGERVKTFLTKESIVLWDGTNNMRERVSPGIYYYVVLKKDDTLLAKGKVFVIKN